ncbi:MAG: glycosyltransferase family 2 protein [Rhodoferax sp.]
MMVDGLTWFVLGYFIVMNFGYLTLNVLSLFALHRNNQEQALYNMPQAYAGLEPAVSLLIPAYNEESSIVASVRSMLQLSYPDYELIVINDGSKDRTLQTLIQEFSLSPFPETFRGHIPTQRINAVYRSSKIRNLRVIDKKNGGKADSLNAGINLAHHPLFCGVDADSILERDSLDRVVQPFLRSPEMVATGGTVRVANGCHITNGTLNSVGLPDSLLAKFQIVEYLRAFLFGRLGWSRWNALLIVSGAFGLFRTDTVLSVGGYKTKTIGEDMELVVRLHHELSKRGEPYRIEYVPEPVCWTEAPEDINTLKNQRIRWQRGLCESLCSHWGLMFSRTGGAAGWLAFPFMLLFEMLSPLLEAFGYLFMVTAILAGWISWPMFASFMLVSVGLGILLSVSGLLLEEMSFHLYPKGSQLATLGLMVVAENFGYRQLNTWWRLQGLYRWATQGEGQWGVMKRKGIG